MNVWVLRASLAANVFLAALAAAPLLRPHRTPGFAGMVDRLSRNLSAEDADRFRAVLAQDRPWYDAQRRQMDQSRAELARAIVAMPYDEAKARDAMRLWQSGWLETTDRFGNSLLAAIARLSPDGRAVLANAANRPPP